MSILARLVLIALAGLVTVWAVFRFWEATPEATLRSVASEIAAGERFKEEALLALEPTITSAESKPVQSPELLRSIAVIRLRQAEDDLSAGQSPSKSQFFTRAEEASRKALEYAPTDAFLWYSLAWIAKNRTGYGPDVERFLRLSYETGPHEGWVAVHRCGFSLAMMSALPLGLQAAAIKEFQNLVTSGYVADAAAILTGPGWAVHQVLLDALGATPETDRAQFAHKVADLGFTVAVPGVARSLDRPWK